MLAGHVQVVFGACLLPRVVAVLRRRSGVIFHGLTTVGVALLFEILWPVTLWLLW